jgi:flagellin
MLKLSTGKKINSAKNDAAGLAIANKLGLQSIGLARASQNSMDGVSLLQTADGALDGVVNMIHRMRELALQAANGVLTPEDQSKIQAEVEEIVEEITANAMKTEFNKIKVLNGEASAVAELSEQADPQGGVLALEDDISSVLFTSSSVPPGVLNYTVEKAGRPPEAEIKIADLEGFESSVRINGASVQISPDDDAAAIRGKLAEAANYANVEIKYKAQLGASGLDYDYSALYIAGKRAGKGESLDVQIVSQTGASTASKTYGEDAILSNVSYLMPDGSTPNESFNSSMGILINGNDIRISASGSQAIRLSLKTFFFPKGNGDPNEDFVYDDMKIAGGNPPTIQEGTPIDSALPMKLTLQGYGRLYLQVGPNYNQHMPLNIPKVNSETLGLTEFRGGKTVMMMDFMSQEGASKAIGILDRALADVLAVRSSLGAYENRLNQTVKNLDFTAENTERSRSRLEDTDMAASMTAYTQLNVRYQAGIAILAQANQRPQQILSLLQ